jgi:hypothetical protein
MSRFGPERTARLNSCSAAHALRRICNEVLFRMMKRSAKLLWNIWITFRPRVRLRRKLLSAKLISKFLHAMKYTTVFVVALSNFMKTVRGVQAHLRGGRGMRGTRLALARQQILRGVPLSQAADTARAAALTQQFEASQAEILSRKAGARVSKCIKIAELRAEHDRELAIINRRSCKSSVDVLLANQSILFSLVDSAVARRLQDYSKQLARYAKALVRYIETMDDLKARGLVPKRKMKKVVRSAAEIELEQSMRPKGKPAQETKVLKSNVAKLKVDIPSLPVRPYFHALFTFDEMQALFDEALDNLGVTVT